MSGFRRLLMANAGAIRYPSDMTVVILRPTATALECRLTINGVNTISWGDGTYTETNVSSATAFSHTYAEAGDYTVTVQGSATILHTGWNTKYGARLHGLIQLSKRLTNIGGLAYFGAVNYIAKDFVFHEGLTQAADAFRMPSHGFDLTNLRLPDSLTRAANMFLGSACTGDITHFFDNWTTSRNREVNQLFSGVKTITGTAPAHLLWESGNTFSNTENCFYNCTGLSNYNEIPASWGGGGA